MITIHSINLIYEPKQACYAEWFGGNCNTLYEKHPGCGTYKCPFFKPKGKEDWVRVEDEHGVAIVPLEEYRNVRMLAYRERERSDL